MPFMFRLQAFCPPGYGLTVPESAVMPRVVFTADPVVVELKATKADASRPTAVILTGRGYSTERDARSAGESAKTALRASGVEHAVPLDLGDDRARSMLFRGFREALEEESGAQIRGDVHGLDVYEDDGRPVKVFSMSANPVVSRNLDDFSVSLERFLGGGPVLGADLTLAIDLYSLAMFETSERARFLSLVTALEVLSEQTPRPDRVLQHIKGLMSSTRAEIRRASYPDEKRSFESLQSSLADLREQSITSAIRDLVSAHVAGDATFNGVTADQFAAHCYSARSKLVHEGHHEDVARLTGQLRALVRAVLLDCMTG